MLDQGLCDEKVLAVANRDPRYREIQNYSEIYPHVLLEIEHFFSIYKDLERKRTQIAGWHDQSAARKVITESSQRFLQRAA